MFEIIIPPALILLIGAFLVAIVQPALRPMIALGAPLATLYAIWQVPDGILLSAMFLGYEVQLIEGGPLRRLFATVFAIMTFGGALFSFKQAKWYELSAAMAYASGAIGVSFAGDLIVMFVFWELMALFSVIVVWSGGTLGSKRAGIRYIVMHLVGGILLKVGIEGIMVHTGSVEIRPLVLDNFDTWLVLIGILVNAAAPPVSAWLADAYPESSPTGSVFLSAFTTKTAVLALILLFPGEPLLIGIGLWMVFYGIIYALLENDIRRILSYSIINQVGFMVVAVGIGTEMALNGAAAHAFAHIFYKALLFMSAGAVIYQTGRNKCTDLGGLYQSMPLTALCGIIGALSISSFPLTSGFIAKSLTMTAAADGGLGFVWYMLVAASAGVFLHAGIKFPWFVFFQKDSGLRPKDPPWNMQVAMILFSVICIGLGVFPQLLYALLPYPVDYVPYTAEHVITQLQLLLFAGLAFFVMLPMMKRTLTISLDLDWLWRVGWVTVFRIGETALRAVRRSAAQGSGAVMQWVRTGLMRHHGAEGMLARAWPTGSMLLWVAVLLAGFMIARYA
jgi:multicomponent Na+:H+ antiporter subunit D